IVAVHGLGGDLIPTWTHPKSNAFWLKDFLPQQIPDARIMTFGYNASATFGESMSDVIDHAKSLLSSLVDKREESEALLQARLEPQYQFICDATLGIIFFGTPHRGSEKALYGTVLENIAQTMTHQPNSRLLKALQTNSDVLLRLTSDFRHQLSQYHIVSFYEQQPMRIFSDLIVEKHSALLEVEHEEQIPVDANHSMMCKFETNGNETYEKVYKRIRRMSRDPEPTKTFPDERLLEKLAYVGDASFSSYENQRHRPCLENTRVDVLQQIMQWAKSTSPQCIFWLKGMAGTGKSTVAITVASQMRQITKNFASYFFKRGVGDLAHARKLIPTIVRQLSHSSSSYRRLVLATVKEEPDLGQSANLREQYEKLVVEPLAKLQSSMSTQRLFVIVIDALDECDEEKDLRLLLRLLAKTKNMSNLGIRVFVTSRPEWPIRLGFQEMPSILYQDLILHDVPRSVVDADIKIFLSYELEDPEDRYLSALIAKAQGLFIFAATACRYIGGSPQADPQQRLEQICSSIPTNHLMTEDLDQMYTTVLQNYFKGRYTEEERQRINLRFRHIVGSIVVLLNTLSIPELFKLLCDAQLQAQYQLESTLESLHAVLDVPKSIDCSVQVLHLSFRDFLLDQNRCLDRQFWVDEQQTHHKLALGCIRLLSSSLKQNICRLPSPGTLKSEIAQSDVDTALSPAVQYACRYWVDHAQKGKVELLDHGCVHEFIQRHFLHWLEAMSLIDKISEAVIAITNLTAMANLQKSPIMHDLIHDCRRFLLAFRHAITDAPEQLYASALIFSPLQSTVRKVFKDIIPQWIKYRPLHREKWSSSLQTLEGHSSQVDIVVFSPDGQLLASGSQDCTVRLWNMQTGECCSLLKGYSSDVNIVVFSPDCQLVASASCDCTVRLWDAQNGECRSLFEGHSDWVNSVVFSPDGQLVASGSQDCTVRLWDAQTGKCRSLLEGHSGYVQIVVFSPDGQLVASGSWDGTVRLWDAQTGKCRSLFEGHFKWVYSVVFLPDGQLVALGSYDGTERLWDAQTGKCRSLLTGYHNHVFWPDGQLVASASIDGTVQLWDMQTSECRSFFTGHSQRSRRISDVVFLPDVVFSPDGQLVALPSSDRTVRLWNTQTGKCHSLLEGHSDSVGTIVFSPDGQLVASGSHDGTVRLWNAQTGKCCFLLGGNFDKPVNSVVFSPDGQLVASGSRDCRVRLWNVQTGRCRSLLKGHSDSVHAVVFSPDGQLVASGSYDCTVRLWNAQTGKCHSLLEGHFDSVCTVVFSPDGQLVASGSGDGMVGLWDAQTGKCRFLLQGHLNPVNPVVFSPDGQLVASGSAGGTVRLWDIQTGELFSIFPFSSKYPQIEFHIELGLISVNGVAFRIPSEKMTKAVVDDSSCPISNLSIHRSGDWILKSSKRVLWLPPEYRLSCDCSYRNNIVLGLKTGYVHFISCEEGLN
ncbi:hypothetical protein MMC22_006955, partial [Lobaria immixta]|nr:hypothetical protein [Lobaria immixta]